MQSGANAGLVRGQELKEQLLRKQQVRLISGSAYAVLWVKTWAIVGARETNWIQGHVHHLPNHKQYSRAASSACSVALSFLHNLGKSSRSGGWSAAKAQACCVQADRERFAQLDADKTGRAAKTVYRDKEKGTRLEGGAEELQALQEAKKPKHEKPSWGGGIAQVCTVLCGRKSLLCMSSQPSPICAVPILGR